MGLVQAAGLQLTAQSARNGVTGGGLEERAYMEEHGVRIMAQLARACGGWNIPLMDCHACSAALARPRQIAARNHTTRLLMCSYDYVIVYGVGVARFSCMSRCGYDCRTAPLEDVGFSGGSPENAARRPTTAIACYSSVGSRSHRQGRRQGRTGRCRGCRCR